MPKTKKIKEIKAEKYIEPEEFDLELEYDDEPIIIEDIDEYEEIEADENIEEYEEEEDATSSRYNGFNTFMKIFNIIFIILIIAMFMISIDVICVAKYDVGPFFAIKTKTYEDGGTKVYYGIGYKVIKYNQTEGRKGTQIGYWNMPYSTTATEIEDIDFAIEFQNNPEKAAEKYYNQYLNITSNIKTINKEKNKLVLEYTDPDGKYTLEINCSMSSSKEVLANFEKNQKVSVRGTVSKFALKSKKNPNAVYLSDCFIEEAK